MQPPIQGGNSFEENLKKGKSKIEFKLDAKKFIRIVNLYDKPLPPLLPLLSVPSLVINTSSGANRHKNVNRLKFRKLI